MFAWFVMLCFSNVHSQLYNIMHSISPCTNRNRDKFERRSVDCKTISVLSTCARSNVLCVAILTSLSWMGLWRHCWRGQWLGWVHYTDWELDLCLEWLLRFTSYFCLFFLIIFYSMLLKGLDMVVRALWGLEALRVVPWLRPCTHTRLVQGPRPRHNPTRLWSPQCTGNHS